MTVEHVKEITEKLEQEYLHPELIQDNKLHFQCDNKIYRVCMPTQLELMNAEKVKAELECELLESKKFKSLKNLKKLLIESQGCDVELIEKEIKDLDEDVIAIYKSLCKRSDEDEEGIAKDTKAFNDIRKKREELVYEVSKLTSSAIEIQSENYYMAYLTSVCTEQNIESETGVIWEKVWASFDEYLNTPDSEVKFYAIGWLIKLMMSLR